MGELVTVDFKLRIPFKQGSREDRKLLEYRVDIESFSGDEKPITTWEGNIERLKQEGFDRNLFPYEFWDIIIQGYYQKETPELEKLAQELIDSTELTYASNWYGVEMMLKMNKERQQEGKRLSSDNFWKFMDKTQKLHAEHSREEANQLLNKFKDEYEKNVQRLQTITGWEFIFKTPDSTVCTFDAVLTKEDPSVSYGKLAEKNLDLFTFIYGRSFDELMAAIPLPCKNSKGYVQDGPFSAFGGTDNRFVESFDSRFFREDVGIWRPGAFREGDNQFKTYKDLQCISRGVRCVKNDE